MATAAALIRQALQRARVLGAGEAVNGRDLDDSFSILNQMLDAWRIQHLTAWATQWLPVAVPPGAQSITIGPGGTLAIDPRPARLELGLRYTSGGLDYPVRVIDQAEYASIGYKGVGALGPDVAYYDAGFPLATLWLYPQPSGAVTLQVPVLALVPRFAALTTDYAFPPAYERAVVLSLAEELAPIFGAPLDPRLVLQAQQARSALRLANSGVPQLDTGLCVGRGVPPGFFGVFP